MYANALVPDHCLACNGASYSRAHYAPLFAAIGTTWGGSGSTFNVPDLRGRYLRVAGTGFALGELLEDQIKAHKHVIRAWDPTSTGPWHDSTGGSGVISGDSNGKFFADGVCNTLSTGGDETRPKSAVINIAIAY